jgi:pimeloyl-ACP methyl ester carboxylesterase
LEAVLSELPEADSSRIAAAGHSMGGTYALMLAVRHTGVHTVIGLDPSFVSPQPSYVYKFSEAADYDPSRFRGNLVALYRAEINPRTAIVDSLVYASRLLLPIPTAIHADFNGFPIYTSRGAPAEVDSFAIAHRRQAQAVQTYNAVTRFVGCYLSATFSNRSTSTCAIPAGAIAERLPAATTATEEQLFDLMQSNGLSAAEAAARNIASHTPMLLRRPVMLRIVNEQGYAGRPREAAEYAQLLTIVFPDAASFERAGDEWAGVGEKAKARAAYQAALRLEPDRAGLRDKVTGLGYD